jgi:hypothetical protein
MQSREHFLHCSQQQTHIDDILLLCRKAPEGSLVVVTCRKAKHAAASRGSLPLSTGMLALDEPLTRLRRRPQTCAGGSQQAQEAANGRKQPDLTVLEQPLCVSLLGHQGLLQGVDDVELVQVLLCHVRVCGSKQAGGET